MEKLAKHNFDIFLKKLNKYRFYFAENVTKLHCCLQKICFLGKIRFNLIPNHRNQLDENLRRNQDFRHYDERHIHFIGRRKQCHQHWAQIVCLHGKKQHKSVMLPQHAPRNDEEETFSAIHIKFFKVKKDKWSLCKDGNETRGKSFN